MFSLYEIIVASKRRVSAKRYPTISIKIAGSSQYSELDKGKAMTTQELIEIIRACKTGNSAFNELLEKCAAEIEQFLED